MKKQVFIWVVSAAIFCGCVTAQKTESLPDQMQPEQIKSVMANVADWQLANPSKHPATNWTHGALFAGMTAWAQMAGDDKYYEALLDFGKKMIGSWENCPIMRMTMRLARCTWRCTKNTRTPR